MGNIICCTRFGMVLAARLLGSKYLVDLTVQLFPLSFGLGFMLTILYYGLDHFEEANVKKRKEFSVRIAPHCELSAHVSHATALPMAVLDACTLAAHQHPRPEVLIVVSGYILYYMMQTIVNFMATKVWQYEIITDMRRGAGWPGVLLFFAATTGLMVAVAHLGVAIADGVDGWK